MRKFFSIAIASLLIVSSFASCGEQEAEKTTPSSSSSEAVDDAVQEEAEEETSEEATEEETTEEAVEEETTEEASDAETEEETTAFELPELVPDEATEADFIGKWECVKVISTDGTFEDNFMGIPISIMMQVEINEDNTATALSLFDESDEDASMTWTYSENAIVITNSVGDDIDCILQGGEVVIYDEDMQMYLKKVDEFTVVSDEELEQIFGDIASGLGLDEGELTEETTSAEFEIASDEDISE